MGTETGTGHPDDPYFVERLSKKLGLGTRISRHGQEFLWKNKGIALLEDGLVYFAGEYKDKDDVCSEVEANKVNRLKDDL